VNDYSEEVLKKTQNQISEWLAAFSETSFYDNLTSTVQEDVGFVTSIFSDYMYDYHLETPQEWTEYALTDIITDVC